MCPLLTALHPAVAQIIEIKSRYDLRLTEEEEKYYKEKHLDQNEKQDSKKENTESKKLLPLLPYDPHMKERFRKDIEKRAQINLSQYVESLQKSSIGTTKDSSIGGYLDSDS